MIACQKFDPSTPAKNGGAGIKLRVEETVCHAAKLGTPVDA
jgi:hypothetical protein